MMISDHPDGNPSRFFRLKARSKDFPFYYLRFSFAIHANLNKFFSMTNEN